MAVSFARDLDGENALRPGISSNFAAQAYSRASASINTTHADANTSSEEHDVSALVLTPEETSLKQRVHNLLNQGDIYKAVELIEEALENANSPYAEDAILDIAAQTLSTLLENHPYEVGLLERLADTIGEYEPAETIVRRPFGLKSLISK